MKLLPTRTHMVIASSILLLLFGMFSCPERLLAAAQTPDDGGLLGELPLDGLTDREKERVRRAAGRLIRIRGTVGDASRGETSQYLRAVDELARFLKRGTVEDARQLGNEAVAAFDQVDTRWIDRVFAATRNDQVAAGSAGLARLREQEEALKRVGGLLKKVQAIPARQKRLESAVERGYRNLIRLIEEGEQTWESVNHQPSQEVLRRVVEELKTTLDSDIRPAHERQTRLLKIHARVIHQLSGGLAHQVIQQFREYSSKLRVIHRALDRPSDESD